MIIDWKAAPEGTTHATINGGEPYWYKLDGSKVLCWSMKLKEWAPSFFLTVDEITGSGLRLYANGEQSELVMLREQRDALLAAVNEARDYLGGLCDGGPVLLGLVCVLDDAIALVEGTK